MASKLKKGDIVLVCAGKDKGKKGKILAVFPKRERVLVDGVNTVKRHRKPTAERAGGIVLEGRTIHISNVAFFDHQTAKRTRVGFKFLENGRKIRYCKKTGEMIDA